LREGRNERKRRKKGRKEGKKKKHTHTTPKQRGLNERIMKE
jgi:hypothetical protein